MSKRCLHSTHAAHHYQQPSRRNWHDGIRKVGSGDGRNYLRDHGSLRNLRFVNETHDQFGTAGRIVRGVKGAGIHFENLRMEGQTRTGAGSRGSA